MELSLNGSWRLYYHQDGEDLPAYGAWLCIDAQVPGNVELDLHRAGLEPEPFYGNNLYAYFKYEFYRWVFEREFDLPEVLPKKLRIVFEGLNTFADVYINDVMVGHAENMLIAHAFDITSAAKAGRNVIRVEIASSANMARKEDYPVYASSEINGDEYLRVRKPPHSFGWDIMGRFPSAGMWRGVYVEEVKPEYLTQVYFSTRSLEPDGDAQVAFSWRFHSDAYTLEGYSVRIAIGDTVVEQPATFVAGSGAMCIRQPKLWWPRGYGEANLYTATMTLLHHGQAVDTVTQQIGIRVFKVEHSMQPNDAGKFRILCNGVPIMAKGSNWVPLDAMHSRDAQRYDQAVDLFVQANCNIIRCWGGNVYEDHRFFDLCDQHGVMVWQDFTMACALYPHDEKFLRVIEEEATAVIRKLRNHACILLWAGDNECDAGADERCYAPASNKYNPITREVLPRAVRMNDPYRMFLPSSPCLADGIVHEDAPEQHTWGARAWFKDDYYKHATPHFISECGYHGCPAPETLARFIPEDELWPMSESAWMTHSVDNLHGVRRTFNRNRLMADQVRIIFGEMPETLERFAALSQIVQAEAKKFFIEHTRIKKWRRTGIIWWNMLDGWPQISDAVVDYYFTKKRAYDYICRVQHKVCLMLDELRDWGHSVVLGNDSREDFLVQWRVTDAETDEIVLSGETLSRANENVVLGELRVLCGTQKLYLLTWECDGRRYGNHYITGYPHYDAETMLRWAEKIDRLPNGEPI